MKLISIVVPVYNEEDNIEHFHQAVAEVMKTMSYDWELVFVDDGSTDRSQSILIRLAREDHHVNPLFLARNSGHQLALTCGMDNADGDIVITMDGDMQHPPQLIPELVKHWEEGYQVVQTIRKTTEGVSWVKNFTSKSYYKLLNAISEIHVQPGGSDFRLLDREVVLAFRQYREHDRFIRGLIGSIGYRQIQVPFVAPERFAGKSKFSPKKMLNLALNGVLSHSTVPLRISLYLGFASALASLMCFIYVLLSKYLWGDAVAGWPTLVAIILLFGSLQLITLGIIGEYIGHIFREVKNRPLYLVQKNLLKRQGTQDK